jgi:hypothetical protein
MPHWVYSQFLKKFCKVQGMNSDNFSDIYIYIFGIPSYTTLQVTTCSGLFFKPSSGLSLSTLFIFTVASSSEVSHFKKRGYIKKNW